MRPSSRNRLRKPRRKSQWDFLSETIDIPRTMGTTDTMSALLMAYEHIMNTGYTPDRIIISPEWYRAMIEMEIADETI